LPSALSSVYHTISSPQKSSSTTMVWLSLIAL
jgi:hypothetical protein